MGRLLVVFGVLLVTSVLVQASTVDRLTLKTIRRTVSADKTSYIFTVDFQAPSEPDVVWTEQSLEAVVTLTGSMSYDKATKEGTAQLAVKRVKNPRYWDMVYVSLGDLSSHYFYFSWNQEGDKDLVLNPNLPVSHIAPSTDVSYSPGEATDFVLTVKNDRGQFLRRCENTLTGLIGQFYDSAKKDVVAFYGENVQTNAHTNVTQSERGGVTTTTYSFSTDQNTVNGAIRGSLACFVQSYWDSPVMLYIDERVVLSVHESSYSGPFPDNFADVDTYPSRSEEAAIGCLSDVNTCPVLCSATANDLETVTVFKIADDGKRRAIGSSSYVEFYKIHLTVDLKTGGQAVVGRYVCQATRDSGSTPVEDVFTVEEVTQRAKVDTLLTQDVDDGEAVLVTCDGSGSNTLQVGLFWSKREPLVVGEKGVETYTPGTSSDGGSATATARINVSDSSDTTFLLCYARNSASSGSDYTWI